LPKSLHPAIELYKRGRFLVHLSENGLEFKQQGCKYRTHSTHKKKFSKVECFDSQDFSCKCCYPKAGKEEAASADKALAKADSNQQDSSHKPQSFHGAPTRQRNQLQKTRQNTGTARFSKPAHIGSPCFNGQVFHNQNKQEMLGLLQWGALYLEHLDALVP
jgi:hypothetical protein